MGLLVSINGADFEPYVTGVTKLPLVGRKQAAQRVEPIHRDMGKPGEFNELLKKSPTPTQKKAQEAYKEVAETTPTRTPRKAIHARELMTSPVHCLSENQNTNEALDLFRSKSIQHAPIVNKSGIIQGILSDRNLLMADSTTLLKELMSLNIVAAQPDTLLTEITRAMLDHSIHCVPVLNAERVPLGMITSTDILESVLLNPNLDFLV